MVSSNPMDREKPDSVPGHVRARALSSGADRGRPPICRGAAETVAAEPVSALAQQNEGRGEGPLSALSA